MRREPGPLYAFAQQTLYSVGIASVGLGIARGMLDAFLELALRKTPCGTGRLADNAVMQAGEARADAHVGAARANFLNTVIEIYRQAGAASPIDVMDRARARLAGSHAITSAVAAGDWTYKAAGVGAIFPGARSRAVFAISTHCRSRSGRATRITRRSARYYSATPPEVFFKVQTGTGISLVTAPVSCPSVRRAVRRPDHPRR